MFLRTAAFLFRPTKFSCRERLYYGSKWSYILQAFGLVKAMLSRASYVINESDQKTYRARVNSDGTLSDLKLFTNRSGESLTEDAEGNVYLAAGQILCIGLPVNWWKPSKFPSDPRRFFSAAEINTRFSSSLTTHSTRPEPGELSTITIDNTSLFCECSIDAKQN
jgi:hypothetical protein